MTKNFRAVERKCLDRKKLVELIPVEKEKGKKIVFTNGCFDILHIGHIRYLQDARNQGDLLIVGVNSDESVRALKGPERPVVNEKERIEILAALECVDYVTLFSELTPVDLILAIKPNIHVKGGDYSKDELPEAEAVRSVGGIVKIVSYVDTGTEGKSTTKIIGKIVGNDCK
ncbi:MAG: D-glycero-beta-D-manno-heptose 1-phosphate adenylyltransferase [Armatimonadota bacterium]